MSLNRISKFKIFCHELGHQLGMPHDFIGDHETLLDSQGNSCTYVGGIMDYTATAAMNKWTTCSVEAFTKYYNDVVAQSGRFCLDLAEKPGILLIPKFVMGFTSLS